MVKRASWLKTALYVKCCSVSLMHAYGGCWDRHESLPHPISLARLERPRVIRNFHRRLIRRHDVRADGLVKMYLSMFSVSKLILVPKQSNYQYPQKIIRVGRLFGLGRLKVASDEDRPPRVPPVKIAELPSDSFNNERQKASNGNLCLCLCPSSYGSKLGHTKEGKVACRIWLKDKRLSNREELLDLPTHDDMRFKTPLNNVKAADPDYFLDPSSGMKDGQPNYLEEREEFSIDRGTRDIPVAPCSWEMILGRTTSTIRYDFGRDFVEHYPQTCLTPSTYRSSHFLPLALQGPTGLSALDSHLPLPILTFHSLPLVFYSSSSSRLLNRLSLSQILQATFPSFVWPSFDP
uniref:Uncharacterized protein n=1 Tax=Fagus sylvatica TaxID=28930 RepID=A0A2N9FRI4_FAGSY